MRPCKYRIWNRTTKLWENHVGQWQGWSMNYEEFASGPGNFPVAIVEEADGRVVLPVADDVVFTDMLPDLG